KTTKTKTVLKSIEELSQSQIDELTEKLIAKGKAERIIDDDLIDDIDDVDNWLRYHEDELMKLSDQVLGHTITNHVGKTDAELIQRLADEFTQKGKITISASSSFKDVQTAQKVVSKLFSENRDAVKAWMKNSNLGKFEFPEYIGSNNEILGRGITKQEYLNALQNSTNPVCKNLYKAKVVLKRTNDGQKYYILTSFPQ
ncbi:MAG: hypothetical protein H6Q20_2074, partial [Bacteroidetes bacterium]|nr:hypothetical protein [Bacteroidota bacterium]